MKKLSDEAEELRKSILAQFDFRDSATLSILDVAMSAFDMMNEAQAVIDSDGLTVEGDRGHVKAHPCCAVVRDARSQFLIAMRQLDFEIAEAPAKRVGAPTSYEKWAKKGGR